MFEVLDIGASGLLAQRVRMDTIAGNVLHMNTTRNERGEPVPYRRKFVVFEPTRSDRGQSPGVRVAGIGEDQAPFIRRFEPSHPDADRDGYVQYPNVDLAVEMVNMLDASRAYEANITMMETTKQMLNATLRLLA